MELPVDHEVYKAFRSTRLAQHVLSRQRPVIVDTRLAPITGRFSSSETD